MMSVDRVMQSFSGSKVVFLKHDAKNSYFKVIT